MPRQPDTDLPVGTVVLYPNRVHEPEHEVAVHHELGRRLAALLGYGFGGVYRPEDDYPGPLYFLPSDSLIGTDQARHLGIRSEADLFGGVVPQAFVATKAITHPLLEPHGDAPDGWSRAFGEQVRDAVLAGYSAFTRDDALRAAERLLEAGPVRVKTVRATAGRGQMRVTDARQLRQVLDACDPVELAAYGVVLEENLDDVVTYSVGQVRVGRQVASYYGTQSLTLDNQGETVYGGSDLVVARGDFDALLTLTLPEPARRAVEQARRYDRAADACFPGFFASRRNYDIAQGLDGAGRSRSGVLEQSWRVGGASAAEIVALEGFAADPRARAFRASTHECFGVGQVPADAAVLFHGLDADLGFMSKYVKVEVYEDDPQ
ncbi:DUF3182 family protein [Pseudomonas mangiferae]|uniref:DUF3182 family protein n=1 Tax=Pseudomonas mangiferae TaxID=2593654 RepID=A0A553GWD8_9PSED|nr:DUF3182 family protein [Pseudomonas mangiferae]TRX73775.1 DUF3182 family protein [Pseudomonas mangiferae]